MVAPMRDTIRAIAAKMRQARREDELTQDEVANLLGISRKAYVGREQARVPFSFAEVATFADATKRPIDFFKPGRAS